jgi:hypothetical protein
MKRQKELMFHYYKSLGLKSLITLWSTSVYRQLPSTERQVRVSNVKYELYRVIRRDGYSMKKL